MTTVNLSCGAVTSARQEKNLPIMKTVNEDRLIAQAKSILFRRFAQERVSFTKPNFIKDYLLLELAERESEGFYLGCLDSKHRLIEFKVLSEGTIDRCDVYPREVIKAVLAVNAAAVFFAHNHPSGDASPSEADKRITQRLRDGLALLDVRTIDHLIVGSAEVISLAEMGDI